MSGFAGIVFPDIAAGGTPSHAIQRMAASVALPGPDAQHVASIAGAELCFSLLRTGPNPQIERQPCSLDGKTWLIGDIRLDARDELLSALHLPPADSSPPPSDEEIVLHAWREWGDSALPKLHGDFSFALWNQESRELWCARDLMGIRPFFYSHRAERFCFSNAMNAVRQCAGVSDELDPEFIGDFLLQGLCLQPEKTAFAGIRRLLAGHLLKFSGGSLDVRRFTELPIEEPLRLKREGEYVEHFRELLFQAVRERMPDAPVAVLLSGGLDSSSIAAAASQIARSNRTGRTVRAYTADYRPLFEDQEALLAAETAKRLGIPHEIHSCDNLQPFAEADGETVRAPEPVIFPTLSFFRSQYAAMCRHSRVIFKGYGGDNLLAGESWPYLVYLLRRFRIGTMARDFGGFVLSHGRIPPLRGGFRQRMRSWSGRDDAMKGYPPWLAKDFEHQFLLRDRWKELHATPASAHPIHRRGYFTLTNSFWPLVMEFEDPAWTGTPTQTRVPLLDERLLRFQLRVPPVPLCIDKQILREAMRGLLPESVRLRRKTPLPQSPLLLSMKKHGRTLRRPRTLAKAVERFVDASKLSGSDATIGEEQLRSILPPLQLDRWLKSIEKGGAA